VLAKSTDGTQNARLTNRDELAVYDTRTSQAERIQWKHMFPAPIVCAKFVGKQQWLLVQTDAFVTEIWNPRSGQRMGAPIDETRLFTRAETPAKPLASAFDADGGKVLTRSFFFDPPNADNYWYTVWDLTSGIPLVDWVRSGFSHAEL